MEDGVYFKKTFSSVVMGDRQFMSHAMLALLDNPDAFWDDSNTEIIQNNFKSKLALL